MGIFDRLKGWGRKDAGESVTTSLDLFREIYGHAPSHSGKTVTWATALEVATVLACVRVLANGLCQVPFRVYREVEGRRLLAREHPLFILLWRKPNGWQTSFEFRETLAYHLLLCGNAFVFVNRVGLAREVRELVPIVPGRVEVKQNADLTLSYRVRGENGRFTDFPQEAIWHLRLAAWNGWMGLESVKLAREAVGLSMALEQSQAETEKNGFGISGNYAVEGNLPEEKFHFLAAWLDRHLPGGDRYGKPLITDQGASFIQTVMSAVDKQLVESRKHQIEEVCRAFGVMPIMVGHADKTATYASAEQMFLAHVVHSLAPHYERIEQSADVNLLSDRDLAAGYYTKFTPNALMRGAAKDRAEFYAKGLGAGGVKGWLTQNDVRDFEDMDRSDDPEADKLPSSVTSTPMAT